MINSINLRSLRQQWQEALKLQVVDFVTKRGWKLEVLEISSDCIGLQVASYATWQRMYRP